ncbi:MAG: TonB family protein [Pseudomonadota bacterium]
MTESATFSGNGLLTRAKATVLALGLIALVVSTLFMGNAVVEPDIVTVRKITVGLPPPPPPPPTQIEQVTEIAPVQMNLLAELDTGTPLIRPTVASPELRPPEIPPPKLDANRPDLDTVLSFDWSGFGLSELDFSPRLLTDMKVRFPTSLRSRGVRRVAVELSVLIDESGRVFLKEILSNPHPQLNNAIESITRRARFTPPQKEGVKVRAAFIWPIEFSDE